MTILTITDGLTTFTTDNVVTAPEIIDSLLVSINIPGIEGGDIQYLGSPPKRLTIAGVLKGSSAKADLEELQALRSSGLPCTVSLASFGQTWLQATYLIARLTWAFLSGSVNVAGGVVLQFTVELISTLR